LLQAAQWKPTSVEKPSRPAEVKVKGSGINGMRWPGGRVSEGFGASPSALAGEELSEFFAAVNLLSVVCKAVIQGHNGHQKLQMAKNGHHKLMKAQNGHIGKASGLTFTHLMDSLSVGTKSDLANNLLESLAVCAHTWQGRLGLGLHSHFHAMGAAVFFQNSKLVVGKKGTKLADLPWKSLIVSRSEEESAVGGSIRVRFLLQDSPQIPASSIFKALTEKLLPLPVSVEEFISRLFKP